MSDIEGKLGDCWLLAGMSCLATQPTLLRQVVVPGQSLSHQYAGVFLFRFWLYGDWVEVVVDDLLPCTGGRLAFIHSDSDSEFWSPLLEKAYAKLHGSYKNISGGFSPDSLVNFTGGSPQSFDLADMAAAGQSGELFTTLLDCYARNAIICADVSSKNEADDQARKSKGLLTRHEYSVTKVLKLEEGKQFVRVR